MKIVPFIPFYKRPEGKKIHPIEQLFLDAENVETETDGHKYSSSVLFETAAELHEFFRIKSKLASRFSFYEHLHENGTVSIHATRKV